VFGAGEDYPEWLDPAHDKPIEDEQVNGVEDERHAEGIGEEFPEGATSPLVLRSGRDDLSDFLRIVP